MWISDNFLEITEDVSQMLRRPDLEAGPALDQDHELGLPGEEEDDALDGGMYLPCQNKYPSCSTADVFCLMSSY